jgi:Cu-Zn family superoxide dismutase
LLEEPGTKRAYLLNFFFTEYAGRELTELLGGPESARGPLGIEKPDDPLHFESFGGKLSANAISGRVLQFPAISDQTEKALPVTEARLDRVMSHVVEGEMGGVLRLFLPGNGTVRAGATQHSRPVRLFQNLDRHHHTVDCMRILPVRYSMTKRLISLAAMGLFSVALYAANKPVTVTLKDAMGKTVGTAKLTDGSGGKGVKITASLMGLPDGEHAFHIHTTAKCEAPGFTTAGGHFNPEGKHHGINNPMDPKPHDGDMANFTVKGGKAKVSVVNNGVTLGDGPNSVFTGGGTALMIHAKADDLMSDPSGNAGDRIACGVIMK